MQANVSIGQLRVLVTVIEESSFTAAAKALGLTQSAVSQAVQSLEDAVGVKLVARRREGIELTEIGRLAQVRLGALIDLDRFAHDCTQLRFHRTAMLCRAHAQPLFDRRIDIADRQRRHRCLVQLHADIVLNDSVECNCAR
jgi:DNA-binding transcriptional LysR family regulator